MNREMLTVKGLKGDYTLYIDGERIGTWAGKQLGEGISLMVPDAAVPAGDGGDAPERIPLGNRTQLPRLRLGAVRFLPEQGAARRQRRTCRERARRGKGKGASDRENRSTASRRTMLPHRPQARAQQMELLVETIYEINKPQTRKVVLRPN